MSLEKLNMHDVRLIVEKDIKLNISEKRGNMVLDLSSYDLSLENTSLCVYMMILQKET